MRKILFAAAVLLSTTAAFGQGKPKNVILMIGDGMGPEQVRTLQYLKEGEPGTMATFPYQGFSMTYSLSDSITDSAAGGSALSTGKKTNNGYIAMAPDSTANETLAEWARKRGMATGIVATVDITDATPADFYAHAPSRKMREEIARQLPYSGLDYAVGGTLNHFLPEKRKDGLNLVDTFAAKGYKMVYNLADLQQVAETPVVGLLTEDAPPHADERGEWLPAATTKALELLEKDSDGFFLMVEGSQIDWACHYNDFGWLCDELLDFDIAVRIAYEYAQSHPGTLLVVTADHETGGYQINDKIDKLSPKAARKKLGKFASFSKTNHTGRNVGVYAFGPGADLFQGVMENTDIPKKIKTTVE